MAKRLFQVGVGISDGKISYLSGTGAPGGDAGVQDAALIGSQYTDNTAGNIALYKKVTAGAGAGNWERLPDLADIVGIGNTRSWREPAKLYTTVTQADFLIDANADDTVQGVAIAAGDRILINDGTASPNVYIVGGSTGAWTLTEDTNLETNGDTIKVLEGTGAGNEYTFNGTVWIWTDNNTGAEDGFQNAFMGKSAVGGETPTYTSNNYVANADALTTAIGKLDAQAAVQSTETTTNSTAISALQAADITHTADIATNATNIATNAADIAALQTTTSANSTAITALQAQDATHTADIAANATAITALQASTGSIQAELDLTQASLGSSIDANGNYVAHTTTTYVNNNTSITADILALDAAIAALGTGSLTALQTEVNNIETSLGAMVDVNGNYVPFVASNYMNAAGSVSTALEALDTQIKTTSDVAVANQAELTNTQNSLGASVDTNGNFVAFTTTNYMNGATDLTGAILALDAQAQANSTNGSNIQAELDATQSALGAMIDVNGAYVPFTGTNYLNAATDSSGALIALDTQVKVNSDLLATHTTEIAALQAAVSDSVTPISATGINSFVADSVLVDNVATGKWLVVVTDPANGNRFVGEFLMANDGYGVNDATQVDITDYAELDFDVNIPGLDINATLTGAGATQSMNLVVTATVTVDVKATRLTVLAA